MLLFTCKVSLLFASAATHPLFNVRHLIPLAGCCAIVVQGLPTVDYLHGNFIYSLYTFALFLLHSAFRSSVCVCAQSTLLPGRGPLLLEWLVLQPGHITLLLGYKALCCWSSLYCR